MSRIALNTYKLFMVFAWGLICTSQAQAVSVAVVPVEDLSQGKNGVNFEITEQLGNQLRKKGLDVVTTDAIMPFLVRNRIRSMGHLDTYHILLAGEQLNVDMLLISSISQRQEEPYPVLGLSVQLVRTSDVRIVWSNSFGLSTEDMQRILGIGEPESVQELWPILMEKIVKDWPEQYDIPAIDNQLVDITSMTLEPRYVQPGEQVRCKISLRSLGKIFGRPQVFVKAGSRVYAAEEADDEGQYEVVWVGSEGWEQEFGGVYQDNTIAMIDPEARVFESLWIGAQTEARYPVNLILSWPSGERKTLFLGDYIVDAQPPKVALSMKGVEHNGEIVFRDKVIVVPYLLDSEPLRRYEISVENEDGDVLVLEDGRGEFFPSRFVWRGTKSDGIPVEKGRYKIILKLWDRAKNVSTVARYVYYNPVFAEAVVETEVNGNQLQMEVLYDGEIPIDYWHLELRFADGELIKMADGFEQPEKVTMEVSSLGQRRDVEGFIMMKDILGNKAVHKMGEEITLALQKSEGPVNSEESETPSKEESSGWLSEF
jgi:TolB-like protein